MHRSAVTNPTSLHHEDDDVDLLYYCNVFVSLFSVSGLLTFEKHILQGIPFNGRFQI